MDLGEVYKDIYICRERMCECVSVRAEWGTKLDLGESDIERMSECVRVSRGGNQIGLCKIFISFRGVWGDPWYLYQTGTQNILRTHKRKRYFGIFEEKKHDL